MKRLLRDWYDFPPLEDRSFCAALELRRGEEMSPCLNLQCCIYPLFNGGLYFARPKGSLNFRASLGFIDFRVWWMGSHVPLPPQRAETPVRHETTNPRGQI